MERKTEALRILKGNQASNKNYIFSKDNVYELIEAVDPEWQGALPYTLLIEPGGKILYRKQDTIDPLQMKKLIVGSKYLGRSLAKSPAYCFLLCQIPQLIPPALMEQQRLVRPGLGIMNAVTLAAFL